MFRAGPTTSRDKPIQNETVANSHPKSEGETANFTLSIGVICKGLELLVSWARNVVLSAMRQRNFRFH